MKRLFLLMTMVAVVLSACGGRDLSNVKTSLYGHWVDEESGTDYYISDGSYIQVDDEGTKEKTYKVIEHDEVKNYIKIQEEDEEGSGFIREITFDNDERASVEVLTHTPTIELSEDEGNLEQAMLYEIFEERFAEVNSNTVFEFNWKYVDNKQKP